MCETEMNDIEQINVDARRDGAKAGNIYYWSFAVSLKRSNDDIITIPRKRRVNTLSYLK